jgi:hypothetical protein
MMRYYLDGNPTPTRLSITMRKTAILLACLTCLPMIACKPHPGSILRAGDHERRHEERGGQRHGGLRRDCRDDLEKFCAADQKGRDRRTCLQSHINEISAECKTAVEARGHKGGGRRNRNSNTDSNDD